LATFFVFVTGCTIVRHLAISRFDRFHGKSAMAGNQKKGGIAMKKIGNLLKKWG